MENIKIFAGRSTKALAEKVVQKLHGDEAKLNDVEIVQFNDGEINVHFNESIRQERVFIIQSTASGSDNIIETFLMIDAAKRASAKEIIVIIPYYGYARSDRKDKPRVPIAAKLMADLLTTSGATRIVTIDLHADQIQGFFNIPVDHLTSAHSIIPYIRENYDTSNVVIASPDAGGAKRASRYSRALDTDLVLAHKERSKPGVISSMKLIGDVTGKDVFIIDDMIDTGGSITKAANLMSEKGAKSVRAICTHALLTGNAYDNINSSELIEVITTDTIPVKHELSDKLLVISVDNMISIAIGNIVNGESMSDELFGTL